MPYFERTKRLSNILVGISIISFLVACIVFLQGDVYDQIFPFSNGNYVRNGIIFTIFFLLSVFTLIIGFALKSVVKDAKEEIEAVKREFNEKIK
jgi:uncharacterized membrane protein